MPRHESDREDLFAEATALVRRAELFLPSMPEPIVAGFKRDGGLSLYLGPDPAYHFDPQGRLKRAYRSGRLYRTQEDTLAELTKVVRLSETDCPTLRVGPHCPTGGGTQTLLVRRDLTPDETESFLAQMSQHLASLATSLERDEARLERCAPPDDALFLSDLVAFLGQTLRTPARLAPRYKGKR